MVRHHLKTALLGLLLVAATATACTHQATAVAPSARAVPTVSTTLAPLDAALLVTGDLRDWHFEPAPVLSSSRPPARPVRCQPIDDAWADQLNPRPNAAYGRLATALSGTAESTTLTILVAETGTATSYIPAIRRAVHQCGSGYANAKATFTSVHELPKPPTTDETIAFRMIGDSNTDDTDVIVIRHHTTLLIIESIALAIGVDHIPDEVITAQLTKMTNANL